MDNKDFIFGDFTSKWTVVKSKHYKDERDLPPVSKKNDASSASISEKCSLTKIGIQTSAIAREAIVSE